MNVDKQEQVDEPVPDDVLLVADDKVKRSIEQKLRLLWVRDDRDLHCWRIFMAGSIDNYSRERVQGLLEHVVGWHLTSNFIDCNRRLIGGEQLKVWDIEYSRCAEPTCFPARTAPLIE